jgi:catechol 2,3-dioxygenase-like lactoylglutathione lyase family enzyme
MGGFGAVALAVPNGFGRGGVTMRALWLTLAAIIACLACSLGAVAQSPQISGIAHVAFRVSDLDGARAFYRNLGFEESFAFTSGEKITQVFVKINDRQFIELYPRTEEAQPLGWLHVCFETDAAEALHALYAERGLNPAPLVKGGAGNFIFSLDDPEGRQIEVTQYLPGSRHVMDQGKHLGAGRISDELREVRMTALDLAVAEQFYIAGLGFEKQKGKLRMRISRQADQRIEIAPANTVGMPQFVFLVSSTSRTAARLRKLGVKVTSHGSMVQVNDPDGNVLVFQKRP